ncbi:MAG TPA: 16S rRNA (cytosine(967)-C(5))-methyltransferase RsmB [Verrucomicrobiae bacterium]|nr:16S rRNA (cytosine(967)-C(5))-methyltransferase RsmB [Verrucomicrobiae bacterium]
MTMAILKTVSGQKPRQIAMDVLKRRLFQQDYTEDLFEKEMSKHRLSPADRGLCQELVYGIARWQMTLDWLISRKTAGRTQKEELRILLQLGLYQMFWLNRVPDHAAVHVTVELAKHMGFGPQAGFVNAILRGYTRERDETKKLLAELKTTQPSMGYSHPEWLWKRWQQHWDAEKAARLMEWNDTPPPTYARVNLLKTDATKLAAIWESEGVKFRPLGESVEGRDIALRCPRTAQRAVPTLSEGTTTEQATRLTQPWDWVKGDELFELESHPPLASLRSLRDGLFYIQDPSTLLAVQVLDPQPNEIVLDLCAAPGGKTTFIAQRMQNRGRIIAQDIQADRLDLVRENCSRLGVTCAEVSLAPSGVIANPAKKFDRVLVDAPCSNTGVMRRRVDLRWRIRPEEIERLRNAQIDLLRQAAPRLKPDGALVYSTCSLEPEENAEVVKQFLVEHPKFSLVQERELLPFVEGVDGAYVAQLTLVS